MVRVLRKTLVSDPLDEHHSLIRGANLLYLASVGAAHEVSFQTSDGSKSSLADRRVRRAQLKKPSQ